MRISVIIPVWNGASVIVDCLKALFEQVDSKTEIICVDNASTDESASLIVASFPQVRLCRQPVNLGFAGGVNAGIEAAEGDAFILLNQDCVVQPGWMPLLLQVLEPSMKVIAGCMLLSRDGVIDHVGAVIRRPEAIGVHLTELEGDAPRSVEYVSGAVFAFHRKTWETVGRFDEGFYPAYYEDADYCFRARRRGVEILCIPQAQVVHLRSSEAWRADPLRHKINHLTARYRFVCKHFEEYDLNRFFDAERVYIKNNCSLEEVLERVIAARRTLFRLPEILMRRKADLAEEVSPVLARQVQVGLEMILREALFTVARAIQNQSFVPGDFQPLQNLAASIQNLQSLQQREYLLLKRIYFRSPTDKRSESRLKRLLRLFILRPLSFIIGRDYLLLAELNTLHVARMDQMAQAMDQTAQVMDQRLKILEMLMRYEWL